MLWILWPVFMVKGPKRSQNHFVWEERCRKAHIYITVVNWHVVIVSQSSKPHFCSKATFCSLPTWITCFHLLSKWQNPSHAIGKIVVLAQGVTFKRHPKPSRPSPPPCTLWPGDRFRFSDFDQAYSKDSFLCVLCLLATPCKVALYQLPSLPATWEGKSSRVRRNLLHPGGMLLPLSIAQTWHLWSRFSGPDSKFSNVALNYAYFYAEMCVPFHGIF